MNASLTPELEQRMLEERDRLYQLKLAKAQQKHFIEESQSRPEEVVRKQKYSRKA